MATDEEVGRWVREAIKHGYGCDMGYTQIRQLLDAGLLMAPPAPPPAVTFRAKAYEWFGGICISAAEMGEATRGKGFRPGAEVDVTVRQVGP